MTDDKPAADAGPPEPGNGPADGTTPDGTSAATAPHGTAPHDSAPHGTAPHDSTAADGGSGGDAANSAAPAALLTRSRRMKVLGGVCGGLGRYFGIDPVIFRVVLAILALTGGMGLISYGIGWLLIPMEGEEETEVRRLLSGRIEASSMTAVFCALVGSGLFLSTIDQGKNQAFSVCLVGAVVGAVYWSQRRRAGLAAADAAAAPPDAAVGGVRPAPPAAQAPPTTNPSWWRTPTGTVSFEKSGAKDGEPGQSGRYPGYLWGPEDVLLDAEETGRVPWAPRTRITVMAEPRDRSLFGLSTFLLAAVAGWIGISATWHSHSLRFILQVGLVSVLGVLGLGLVVAAFMGRRARGVIGWAVLASFLLAGASVLPRSVGTDWSSTTWRPATAAAVRPVYRLGAGRGTLDLTGLAPHGRTVSTVVDMGVGQLRVFVPGNATVRVEARVGIGDVWFTDAGRHDVNISPGQDRRGTFPPPHGVASGGTVTLLLKLGAGEVKVQRGRTS